MTETTQEERFGGARPIKVHKPTSYEEIPLPSPNGSAPGPARLNIRPAESPESEATDLIQAVGTVFRAVTAKIAFHENEARRLREALAPFAQLARQSTTPAPPSDGATIEALLKIAAELKNGESP
jgi:hypothetical protein